MITKSNFASSVLTGAITSAVGQVAGVTAATGARFSTVTLYKPVKLVIWTAGYSNPLQDTTREIVYGYQSSTDNFTLTARGQGGTTAKAWSTGDNIASIPTAEAFDEYQNAMASQNLVQNGNFINNSTNGYGGTADDWTNSNGNPVQGGFPTLTSQNLQDWLGVSASNVRALWTLNGTFNDASANGYNLTAVGSPTDDSNGLMGQAKSFTRASSQAANGTAANANITGAQTWFAWVKPASVGNIMVITGIGASPTGARNIYIDSTNAAGISIAGLSANLLSDVKVQAGKWYFIVGIYDGSTTLTIWVNGVKKTLTVSGSVTALGSNGVAVGRRESFNDLYFDGLIQGAGCLNVALTDNQVKLLWAATSYRGHKLRRNGTDFKFSQQLGMDKVSRMRGKNITLKARLYAANTGQGIYITTDGGSSYSNAYVETANLNTWTEVFVTVTVPATCTSIEVGVRGDTTNANLWVEQVMLAEGDLALTYRHSMEDWNRFPRLLKMDVPAIISGYQYEEGRWYTQAAGVSYVNVSLGTGPTTVAGFIFWGNWLDGYISLALGTGGSVSGQPPTSSLPCPIGGSAAQLTGNSNVGTYYMEDAGISGYAGSFLAGYSDTAVVWQCLLVSGTNVSQGNVQGTRPFTWSTGDLIRGEYHYPIN